MDIERGSLVFGEEYTVVADPQTELRRIAALEFPHIATAVFGEKVNGPSGCSWRCAGDGADVGFGGVGETNAPQAGALPLRI